MNTRSATVRNLLHFPARSSIGLDERFSFSKEQFDSATGYIMKEAFNKFNDFMTKLFEKSTPAEWWVFILSVILLLNLIAL